jgi:anaerobic selenocysteine-containing dehydrogenase
VPFNYAGPHGELAVGSMDRRFFHRLGATLLDRGPLCGAVRGTAYTSIFGNAPGMPPEQCQYADLIVVWGNNVTVSNLHLARAIKTARSNGARLVVIDPKRTRIAEQADLCLQPYPGTDVVLALAVAAEMERRGVLDHAFIDRWVAGFDEFMASARRYSREDVARICRIDDEQFDSLVSWYSQADCVAVSLGNGIERGRCGGSALRAAISLQALSGNFGKRGAGVIAKSGISTPKTTARLQRPDLIPEGTRTFNIVDLPALMLDGSLQPPIAATVIYNHNPVCTHPDQARVMRALSRDDLFIAGIDVAMTDSMRYADIVLPAASHFEYADIYGAYGHHYVQRAEPVIPCVGEALPNTEIFRRLAARFGFDEEIFTHSDTQLMDAAFAHDDPRLGGHRPSEIPLTTAYAMTTVDGAELVMCDTVAPATGSGKVELFSADLEQRFGFGVPRYVEMSDSHPLVLISPSSAKRTNATFGGCAESRGAEYLEINPHDAATRNISDGDPVTVWNDLGRVGLLASVTDAVPGVVYSAKGTWLATSPTGQTVNALISADVRTDIERGACYNETLVDIAPAD